MGEPAIRDRITKCSGWVVQRQLGRGQYGTAYLVSGNGQSEGGESEQAVAKVVGLEFLPEKEHNLAFQEVELMRTLKHPHIVALKDHFLTEASLELVIVMEFCDGGDLRGEVKRRTVVTPPDLIPETQIMTWFVQLTLALNYMHQRYILHRDLKSSNIFLTASPSGVGNDVKIGDFGISRVLEGTIDAAATVVGTPYYMSPEVCRAETYGFKSDIWALGCVLYEMCMLKHAFESQSLLGLVYKIVSESYDPIPSQYSAELRSLIDRILDKSHYTRPSGKDVITEAYVKRFDPSSAPAAIEAPKGTPTAAASKLLGATMSRASPSLGPMTASKPQLRQAGNAEAGRPAEPPQGLPTSAPGSSPVEPRRSADVGIDEIERPVRREWCAPLFVAAGPSAAQRPLEEAELRAGVLLSRIRKALAVRRQNWLQVFASFDQKGEGQLGDVEFERAVTSMALGLSDSEIREVRVHLQRPDGSVPVDRFGNALHRTPQEIIVVEEWGRIVLTDMARDAAAKEAGRTDAVTQGAAVRVHGLQSAMGAKLNGCEGIADKWDAATSRWVVKMPDGSMRSVRDENLEVVPGGGLAAAVKNTGMQAGDVPNTTALYRLLCEGGESAAQESHVMSVMARLQPELDEFKRRRLLLLLPKSPEGRVDVAEALAGLVRGFQGDQTIQMGATVLKAARAGLLVPGPSGPTPASPTKSPARPVPGGFAPLPGPVLHQPHWGVPAPIKEHEPASPLPGTVASPRHRAWEAPSSSPVLSPGPAMHGAAGGGSAIGLPPSRTESVRAEVALLRLSQRLRGKPASPGPGIDVLRLFAQRTEEVRIDEFLDAVSVLPLGIARAEAQSVFAHLRGIAGTGQGQPLPFSLLVSTAEAAFVAGVPPEAAALEKLDLKRLVPALQRLGSGAGGRASPQEFRVALMQAEPYLTHSQLEWLTLLADKDSEGRLLPWTLLARLGVMAAQPNRATGANFVAPRGPAGPSKAVAPHAQKTLVLAALLGRVRDRLRAVGGADMSLERVLGLFEIGTGADRTSTVSRDVMAPLLGHLRLGISLAEAEEIVAAAAPFRPGQGASATATANVPLSKLLETVQRAAEPEMERPVQELKDAVRQLLLGRGPAVAAVASSLDCPEWLPEADFRRGIRAALADDSLSPALPAPSEDEEDRFVLLADKNAAGDIRWRPFLQVYTSWPDVDAISESGDRPSKLPQIFAGGASKRDHMSASQQSWRSTKAGGAVSVPSRSAVAQTPATTSATIPSTTAATGGNGGLCCRRRCRA